MANPVVETSVCMCTFGTVPCLMKVSSQATVQMMGQLAATIMDNKFSTFGMCSSLGNPQVASATAAAAGVLTPMPCVPAPPTAPWAPGCPTVMVCNKPLLNNSSKLICAYGGVIQVSMTPALTVQDP